MALGVKEKKGVLGAKPAENLFGHALLPEENARFEHRDLTKSFANERAKVKESVQNYRKIRVQGDNITENTNARSPLTCRNLRLVVAYMQNRKTQRKLENCFVQI